MGQNKNINEYSANDAVVKDIAAAIAGLDYGSVLIKVHNARIVQVEVTERKRYEDLWNVEKGGGI